MHVTSIQAVSLFWIFCEDMSGHGETGEWGRVTGRAIENLLQQIQSDPCNYWKVDIKNDDDNEDRHIQLRG